MEKVVEIIQELQASGHARDADTLTKYYEWWRIGQMRDGELWQQARYLASKDRDTNLQEQQVLNILEFLLENQLHVLAQELREQIQRYRQHRTDGEAVLFRAKRLRLQGIKLVNKL